MKSENHLGTVPVNDLNIGKISFFVLWPGDCQGSDRQAGEVRLAAMWS